MPVVRVALGKHLCGEKAHYRGISRPFPHREKYKQPLKWLAPLFLLFFLFIPWSPQLLFFLEGTTEAPSQHSDFNSLQVQLDTQREQQSSGPAEAACHLSLSAHRRPCLLSQARVITTEENNYVWMHVDCSAHSHNCLFAQLNYTFCSLSIASFHFYFQQRLFKKARDLRRRGVFRFRVQAG